MRIAIIGMGLSGSSVLRSILDHPYLEKEDRIHIFESRDCLGTGMPYEMDSSQKKLNTRADLVSVIRSNANDFVDWIKENIDKSYEVEDRMVSRKDYGLYLQDRFAPYYMHKQVEIHKSYVEDIKILSNEDASDTSFSPDAKIKFTLKYDNEWREEMDAVFLCIGHPQYQDPYDLRDIDGYIEMPYPLKEKLASFKKDDRIGVIGSGATGVDVYRYLFKHYDFHHPVTYLVRSKTFKLPEIFLHKDQKDYQFTIDDEWIAAVREENEGQIALAKIIETVNADTQTRGIDIRNFYEEQKDTTVAMMQKILEENNQDLAYIQSYLNDLSTYFAKLYGHLSGQDKLTALGELNDVVEAFLGPTPHNSAIDIVESANEGKLEHFYGLEEISVVDASKQSDEDLRAAKFLAKADDGSSLPLDYIINATGFDFALTKTFDFNPLLENLYHRNMIQSDIDGKYILAKWPSMHILSKRYGEIQGLHGLGLWFSGTHYRNNDIPAIIRLATEVAENYMENR